MPDTAAVPADVVACGASPDVPLCEDCVDAYRDGIEPGETACEARARGEQVLPSIPHNS